MSINSAMSAGVTGLVANASALAAISDNIANVNTVAYKQNVVNFASAVTAQAVPGDYSAGGVSAVTHSTVSQQGLVQAASSPTDLAINGDGFFVVSQKAGALTPSDPRLFTRAGAFSVDASGYLKNDAGLYLQGWPLNAAGGFTVDPSDLNSMQPINVKSLGAVASPTTSIALNATLDNTTPASAAAATYNATTKSMADYAANANPATGTAPDFTLQMNVTDSLGGSHKLGMSFLKTATANQWQAEIYSIPASDVTVTAPTPAGQLAAGVVAFNPDGSIDLSALGATTLFGAAGAPSTLTLNPSAGATTPQWASSLGLNGQTVTLDLSKLSQISAPDALNSITANGSTAGNVISVQVDANGVVSAVFDNSQIRKIAQVGLATFPNPDGLTPVTGNAYTSSLAAGAMVAKAPGSAGAGQIDPSSLEGSTVDLSTQFTGLITTQKAYAASSKIITTADTMLDELIQVIR